MLKKRGIKMTFSEFFNGVVVPGAISIAVRLLAAAILLIVGNFIIKFFMKRLKNGRFAEKADKTVVSFTFSFVRVVLYVLLAVMVVAALGVDMASIIAVIGSVGLAISLAVQGTLSNLASGIMILVFKPFKEGDYIEANGEGGTVTDLGIFYTTLCTPDNKVVVIPNSAVTSNVLKNYSSMETRRVDVSLTLAHGTDLELVRKVAYGLLNETEKILSDPQPGVKMSEVNGGNIVVSVRAWVKNEDFWDVKFLLNEKLYEKLGEAGVQIPHSQLDVHLKEQK